MEFLCSRGDDPPLPAHIVVCDLQPHNLGNLPIRLISSLLLALLRDPFARFPKRYTLSRLF
jgi:hypothetical protein